MPRPLPSATIVVRRLRAIALSLLVLLVAIAVAPGFQPDAAGRPAAGLIVLDAVPDLGVGEPDSAEWARVRHEAWLRGREAAAEASSRDRAAVAAAASGPGAALPAALTAPAGAGQAIPALALRAYREAAAWAEGFDPSCQLSWTVLAGIGRLESNHGMHFGAATRFSPTGVVSPTITGPPLNGHGVASIPDTDGGRWDLDATWDRAVGPMQFIPSTWRSLGRDGSGDRVGDPNNLFDAAVSAAAYLCLADGSLGDPASLRRAILAYNHSGAYVDDVLRWASVYAGGVAVGPAVPAGPPAPNPPASSITTTTTGPPPPSESTTTRPPTSGTTTSTTIPPTTLPPTSSTTTTTTRGSTTTVPCPPPTTTVGSTTTTPTTTTTAPGPTTTTTAPGPTTTTTAPGPTTTTVSPCPA